MTSHLSDQEERDLEDLFAAAKSQAPEPSPRFQARLRVDAEVELQSQLLMAGRQRKLQDTWLSGLFDLLGGRPGLALASISLLLGLTMGGMDWSPTTLFSADADLAFEDAFFEDALSFDGTFEEDGA